VTAATAGDRVKVTITGTVTDVRPSDRNLVVKADGVRDGFVNIVDYDAPGVEVEVVGRNYPVGTLIRSAQGNVYERTRAGWLGIGETASFGVDWPKKPITVLWEPEQ
jgi:hypothetical protein